MINRGVIDFFIFVSLFKCLYVGESVGAKKRGFWCNDESIRHEFLPQVVDFHFLLFITCFVVPVLISIIDRKNFKYYFRNYYYGLCSNILLTLYCKLMIGRPRPNFFSLCKPTWDYNIKCKLDEKFFVTNYTCSNTNKWLTDNSNKSFYSGHSSLGTYSAMFFIFFLNDKFRIDGLLKAPLFIILFMLGLFPGFTQYLNFWHHASDVIFGDLIGIALAIFMFYGIRFFDHSLIFESKNLNTDNNYFVEDH